MTFGVSDFASGGGFWGPSISGALPTDLLSFSGRESNKHNLLTWQTASEDNTSQFEVQYLNNGDWSTIGAVAATGNINEGSSYEFIDRSPLTESFYRLRILDLDGTFEYSPIISVYRTAETTFKVIPNPVGVGNAITIQNAATGHGPQPLRGAKLELIATDGRQIATLQAMEETNTRFMLPDVPPGVYWVRSISGAREGQVARLVIR